MRTIKKASALATFALAIGVCGSAGAVTIDGSFSTAEWAGYYSTEDWVGSNGYVGPGYGGQSFDVEYLALYMDGNNLYFALQTGFNVTSGVLYGGYLYKPGDFAIDVNNDGVYDYALDFSVSGSTVNYSLYQVTAWKNSMYAQHAAADPFEYKTATTSSPLLSFTGSEGTSGSSYVLEGGFDASYLTLYSGGPVTLHWTMECGNDYLNVTTTPVPEPSTIMLLGGGLLAAFGFAGAMRKRRQG
ncbi:MAG: PEP-CTERM sorting domain-containing protein [Deltaproteobacteria bacterium]|nr:PEP-CTERM sorting domain-containing protein [Deltaproteobacteria bacterium]